MALSRWGGSLGLFLFLGVRTALASGGGYDEAPPTLGYYLQKIPAKSVQQILAEDGKRSRPPKGDDFTLLFADLEKDFATGCSPGLTAKIEGMLQTQRAHYAGPVAVNFLEDLRDLSAAGLATGTETSTYLLWRTRHMDWFVRSSEPSWNTPPIPPERIQELTAKIDSASPALKPHWIYLLGALYFKDGDDAHSEACFDRILSEYSAHPRTEVALFMKARCKFSQAVYPPNSYGAAPPSTSTTWGAAREAFAQYRRTYPEGRFVADAWGWEGGLDYEMTHYAEGLTCFVRQTEVRNHPELFGPAVVMIEKSLSHLGREATPQDYDEVARHPEVALALAYMIVNTAILPESSYERGSEEEQRLGQFRAWRKAALPALAEAVLAHGKLYRGGANQDRYLAILAHAASDQGDQKKALSLVSMGSQASPSDDLAFVRALILQRSGNVGEATSAYRDFLKKFPASPLTSGARFRLALTLHDRKRDGDALVELAALCGNRLPLRAAPPVDFSGILTAGGLPPEDASAIAYDYSGASDAQIRQAIDTLLNFAPLDSLESVLRDDAPSREPLRSDLRAVLRSRYLARNDFRNAARFAETPETEKRWESLASESREMEGASGSQTAQGCWALADFWASSRKKLLPYPLDTVEYRRLLFNDDGEAAGLKRVENAAALRFDSVTANRELEGREELRHAVTWWQRSMEAAPSGDTAPKALWNMLKAARQISMVSPYTYHRAAEDQTGQESQRLYRLLKTRYPDSLEARRYAVYWTLPTLGELTAKSPEQAYWDRWQTAFNPDFDLRIDSWLKAMSLSDDELGSFPSDSATRKAWQTAMARLGAVPQAAQGKDAAWFTREIEAIRDTAKPLVRNPSQAVVMNLLDDLAAFAKVPGVDPDARNAYVALRFRALWTSQIPDLDGFPNYPNYNGAPDPQQDAALRRDIDALAESAKAKPIRDFVEFLQLAVTANHLIDVPAPGIEKDGQPLTYPGRDYALLNQQAHDYLQKFPQSPKREAALLLKIRSIVLLSRPKILPYSKEWPEGDIWDVQDAAWTVQRAPLDAAAASQAFQAYAQEFPQGRYGNAVLSLRVTSDLLRHDWGRALDGLDVLLHQTDAPEFHAEAADGLAHIFERLDDDALRQPILTEILRRPNACRQLGLYLNSGGLPLLKDYLQSCLKAPSHL